MGITMKKSIVISMALFAFAFGANASVVSIARAQKVARAWLVSQGKSTGPLSVPIQRSEAVKLDGLGEDAKYFAVKFQGGGTVVTSGDDTASPVVLFTDKDEDIDFTDANSPLYALLRRDYQYRRDAASAAAKYAKSAQVSVGYRFYLNHQRMLERNRSEWERLSEASDDDGVSALKGTLAWYGQDEWFITTYTAKNLYDVRVMPLVKSRWSQSLANGQACYNFYTPNKKNPLDQYAYAGQRDNAVCGCVATALAQVLRYFAFDKEVTRTNEDFKCSFDDHEITRKLQGGRYDWEKMSLVPGTDFNVTNAMEIGKLCADCGTAVHMMYTTESSGAYSSDAHDALTQVFGYSSARWYRDSGKIGSPTGGGSSVVPPEAFPETRSNELQRVFYSNFDAGLPVLLGLTGHEVVADGYGYSEDGLDYVHINMGWAGECDLWYLLPNVSCDSNGRPEGNLMFFDDCSYNIFTTNAATDVVMSGRVLDDDGNPVSGANVKICRPGEYDDPVAEFVTGGNGIWGLIIAPGTYEVVASDEFVNDSEVFTLSDNRWGCDVALAPRSVRNLMQAAPTNEYSSLDNAIRAANTNDVLEVFGLTRLKKNVTIDRDLTIRTAASFADDPAACLIRVSDSSVITVAGGARVEFDSLAFRSDADTVIDVELEGVAAFSGKLGVGWVHTADVDGFELAGEVDYIDGFTLLVDCNRSAAVVGRQFGVWNPACTPEALASVARILNPWNLDLGGVAADDGTLVWGVVPVDPRYAVAYVDDGSGSPVYYRDLDKLFEYNSSGDLDIKLTKDVAGFGTAVDVTGRKISISSDGGPFTVSGCTSGVGFVVGAGGELTFENVTFDGFKGECFVRIPTDGGVFTLGENALLKDLHAVGTSGQKGLICVCGGRMNMADGSLIAGCSYQNGYGSVITLYGGVLDIAGGTIAGCSAETGGGAIYYSPYYPGAKLQLSGLVNIIGNVVNGASSEVPADICLATGSAVITVVGDLSSDDGIGVCGLHAGIGDVFGTVTGSLSDPGVFFNDDDDGSLDRPIVAVLNGTRLQWEYGEDTFGQCDPAQAKAVVTYAGSAEPLYYSDIATAINNLHGNATIELTEDQYLNTDANVGYRVVINGGGHSIIREASCMINVGSAGELSLNDVTVAGYDYECPWNYTVYNDMYLFADFRGSNKRIISVDGGKITLGDGAEICCLGVDQVMDRLFDTSDPEVLELMMMYYAVTPPDIPDGYDRASCAVVVYNGGTLVMEPGSEIHDCWNMYYQDPVNCGASGGIILEDSVAYLRGGSIYGCLASVGAAMDACQGINGGSKVHLDGPVEMDGNFDLNGNKSDFVLEDLSRLYLDSPFTGYIGFTPGVRADTNRVTEVITGLSAAEVAESATHFFNDQTGARAVGVRSDSGSGYLIVWAPSIGADNKYRETSDGGSTSTWSLIGSEIPESIASFRLTGVAVYNAQIQYALAAAIGCEPVEGGCATNAGEYVCTIRPMAGYIWSDGTAADSNIVWRISPAPLTIYPETGKKRYFILPEDEIAEYEPTPFAFSAEKFYGTDSVENTLTGEISHEYFGQNIWANSYYTIGTLQCTNSNYYIASFNPSQAYLYIDHSRTNDYTVVDPEYTVTTNAPTAIAFSAIVRSNDVQTCTVTITNLVKDANYSVYTVTSLDGGFDVGTLTPVTNFNAEADGPFTMTVPSASPALFWKATGRTTYITNYLGNAEGN